MTGKPGLAPCGHMGFHVFGNYVACPICDAPKPKTAAAPARPKCPHCGKTCTEPFRTDAFKDVWHCGETSKWDGEDGCGHIFQYDAGTGKVESIGKIDASDFSTEEDTFDFIIDDDGGDADYSALVNPYR